jgi:YHS domain-containing protein
MYALISTSTSVQHSAQIGWTSSLPGLSKPFRIDMARPVLFGLTKAGLKAMAIAMVLTLALVSSARATVKPYLVHGVALQGYDAVAYVDETQAVEGSATITATVDGAVYQFANTIHCATFKKNPARYIPAYGGWCAYAMSRGEQVEVDPKHFKLVDGKLLLFYYSLWADTLKKWNADEATLKPAADSWWKKLNP